MYDHVSFYIIFVSIKIKNIMWTHYNKYVDT